MISGNRLRRTYLVSALLGLTLVLVWGRPLRERALAGENDFLQLYAGARLVGTPGLYQPEASYRIEREVTGGHNYYPGIYYIRLPWYAWALKPLGALPYHTAYVIFQTGAIAAVAIFLLLYARQFPRLLVLAAMSPVLLVIVANGQDVGLAVALAAFSVWRTGSSASGDFARGLGLSLCTIKPHLFLLFPLAAVLCRRWRYLAGAAVGAAILAGLSTYAAGWGWGRQYAALLGQGDLHTNVALMPNGRGFAAIAGGGLATELTLGALTLILFVFAAWCAPSFPVAAAVMGAEPVSERLKAVTVLAALPTTAIFILMDAPYSAVAPLLLASILVVAALDAYDRQKRLTTGNVAVGTGSHHGSAPDRGSAALPRPGEA